MADLIFDSFKEFMGDNTIDMDGHVFKIALLSNSYTPDQTDVYFSEVQAAEISGTGYTAGGVALTGVTWTKNGGTTTFDAENPEWANATFTTYYAVIYDDTASNDPLVALFDFGGPKSPSGVPFRVIFDALGIITLS